MADNQKSLEEVYYQVLKTSLDKEGIHPSPSVFITLNGDKEETNMASLMLDPIGILKFAAKSIANENLKEIYFGLDRVSGPGQGINPVYDSVFTIYHYKDGKWRFGCLGYNSDLILQEEIDWDVEFWKTKQKEDLKLVNLWK